MKYLQIINTAAICLLFLAGSAVNAKDIRSNNADTKYWDYQYANEQSGVVPAPPADIGIAPPSGAYGERYNDDYRGNQPRPPVRDYYEPPRRAVPPPPPPRRAVAPAPVSSANCIKGFRIVGDSRGNFRCESETPRCPAGLAFQSVSAEDSGIPKRLQYRCFRPEG